MKGLGPGIPGLVSVVIPVYDGELFLAEAIESVLAQDYRPIEVIAVDDGSGDSSPQILRHYPEIHVIRQANTGCTGARNRGIAAARGEFIAFIDQDDRWSPGKLTRQLAELNASGAGYSLGQLTLFVEPGCPTPAWMGARGWMVGTRRTGYLPGTLVVRRSVLDQLGMFDERFHVGSDAEWLVRARDAGIPVAVVEDVVLEKRIHRANLSRNPEASTDMLMVLAESLKRRRAAQAERA